MRRLSMIGALIMTAALLMALPGFPDWLRFSTAQRADESIRPPESVTLTVWLLDGTREEDTLIRSLCGAYEKQTPGLRLYLRYADAAELSAADAVLPDMALIRTGSVTTPERFFLPLTNPERVDADALASARSSGVLYAVPLWYAPCVLSFPAAWVMPEESETVTPAPSSFFATAAPDAESGPPCVISPETLPWPRLLADGALKVREGAARQQLLFTCPLTARGDMTAALAGAPDEKAEARVLTLSEHLRASRAGSPLIACVLRPAVSDDVRYAALCRESEMARAFLRFLLADENQQKALQTAHLPVTPTGSVTDPLTAETLDLYRCGLFMPNAFAHTRQELLEVCADAFHRGVDPVETLMRLR